MALVKEATAHLPNVRRAVQTGFLSTSRGSMNATVAVMKGLRAVTDFEYEFQMTAALNYELDRELETVHHVSSVHVSRRLSCAKSQAFMATWGSSSPIA